MSEEELDRACVERCLSGDLEAFGSLVERYQRPVFNAIVHLVGNGEDARELCQQAFMKCFEHLRGYDLNRPFFSWMYRIAMNEAINHIKSRPAGEALTDTMADSLPNPEERFQSAEREHRLHAAILSLEPKYRAAIVAKHLLQLSYHEAAEILDLPEKTLKSRLFTARQLLRELLEDARHAAIR